MGQYLNAATAVLRQNKAEFIPLAPGKKVPGAKFAQRLREGKGFTDKELSDYLSRGFGLGLLAQPNFLFIDVDTKEHWRLSNPDKDESEAVDGVANFHEWLHKHNISPEKLYNSTLRAKSPTGGDFLVFLQGENKFTQDIAFIPGVDIKASPNNYIAVEPTRIGDKQYEWVNATQPIIAPEALVNAMHEQGKETKKKIVDANGFDEFGVRYYVRDPEAKDQKPRIDVFDVIAHGFGDSGARNNHLFEFAGVMRNLTDYNTALYYANLANESTDDPIDEKSIEETLASAYSFDSQFAQDLATARLIDIAPKDGIELVKFGGKYKQANLAILKVDYQRLKSTDPKDYAGRVLSLDQFAWINDYVRAALPNVQSGSLFNANKSEDVKKVRELVDDYYAKK